VIKPTNTSCLQEQKLFSDFTDSFERARAALDRLKDLKVLEVMTMRELGTTVFQLDEFCRTIEEINKKVKNYNDQETR